MESKKYSAFDPKATPVLADKYLIVDTEDLEKLKIVTGTQLKEMFGIESITGTKSNTFVVDSDSVLGKLIFDVALGALNKTLTITNDPLTGDQVITLPDASGTIALKADIGVDANLSAAAQAAVAARHSQNTDSGTTGSSFTVASTSVLGKIILSVLAGAADKTLTITNEALTDDRIISFPDKSGTVAMTSDLPLLEEDIIPIEFCKDGAVAPDAAEDYTNTNAKCRIRKFGFAADQDVIFQWPVPKYIDTTVKPQFLVEYIISEAAAPAQNDVITFSLAGYSVGDGDNTTSAFGAAVTSSKTHPAGDAQHDRYVTAQSGDVTVTNLAAGELAFFNLKRVVATAQAYNQKVAVTNIKIFWKRM